MSDTPRTDEMMQRCGALSSIAMMYGYMVEFAKELERDLHHQKALRREAGMALEDKQFCREGLWYCSVGEKMARRIDDLEAMLRASSTRADSE